MVNFKGIADFTRTTFNGSAYFIGSNFHSYAFFSNVLASNFVSFNNVSFKGAADFSNTVVNNFANFSNVSFGGPAKFSNTYIKNSASFYSANFYSSVDFSNADISHSVDLSYTKFNVSSNFIVPDKSGNVVTNDVRICNLFRNYYKSQGRFDDANTVYYDYRRESQAEKEWYNPSKWFDIIYWFMCGYGTRPLNALFSGVIFIILFSLIYLKGPAIYFDSWEKIPFGFKCQGPIISKSSTQNKPNLDINYWDALYVSTIIFTTYGPRDWYVNEDFRKWVALEGTLGWLMLGVFMATYTNTLTRV